MGAVEVGDCSSSPNQQLMVAFDQTGNLLWSVAGNYQPQMATADGGAIATTDDGSRSAVTFDENGNATGQLGYLPTQSWRGNTYQVGSIHRLAAATISWAMGLWATAGGNPSANGSAASLRPSGTVASLKAPFVEATGYMPGVLANAIRVVQNIPACADLFGTPASRASGFGPATVLAALYGDIGTLFPTANMVGGKPVSSSWAYSWYLRGDEADESTSLYIGFFRLATGPHVNINISSWNTEGRSGAINLPPMTAALLHEMGHVYNALAPQGSGGSRIREDNGNLTISSDNDQLIYRTCFP